MHPSEALGAHQFLTLLAENCGSYITALIAHWHHIDFRGCVVPAISVEVALPETLDTEII